MTEWTGTRNVLRTPSREELADFENLMTTPQNKDKSVFENFAVIFAEKNRRKIKASKDYTKEVLACLKCAKQAFREGKIEESATEAFEKVMTLQYKKTQLSSHSYKTTTSGRFIDEETVAVDFACPSCLFGNSFSFRPDQLQTEALSLIDKSKYDA